MIFVEKLFFHNVKKIGCMSKLADHEKSVTLTHKNSLSHIKERRVSDDCHIFCLLSSRL